MKQIEKIAEGAAYTCVSVGEMATLGEHILALGPDVKIPGKVFAGGALQATGAEISFQSFPVDGQTGFLHTHKEHEELYIFIGNHRHLDQIAALGFGRSTRGCHHRFGQMFYGSGT